jgi:hypothetical protein
MGMPAATNLRSIAASAALRSAMPLRGEPMAMAMGRCHEEERLMSRAYNVIDADGHILEPRDLWAKYMDPKFRDRAPRLVTDNATGKEKLLVEQQMLGSEQGMGGIGGVGARQGEIRPPR